MARNELVDEAVQALTKGDTSGAMVIADRFLESAPDDALALWLKGTILLASGDPRGALALLGRSLELDATRASTWFQKGLAHERLGELAPAIEAFQKTTELDPKQIVAWRRLAESLHSSGKSAIVADLLQQAGALHPELLDDLGVVTALCAALNDLGRVGDSLSEFERATKSHPEFLDDGALRFHEAVARNAVGGTENHDRARQALEVTGPALKDPAERGVVRLQVGLALRGLGRHEAAIAAFREARELPLPPFLRGMTLLHEARSQVALGNLAAALALVSDVGKDGIRDAALLLERGVLLQELVRDEEALADLDQAVALDPKLLPAWIARANSLVRLRRFPEALVALETAVELAPTGEPRNYLRLNQVRCHLELNDRASALAALDRAAPTDAASPGFLVQRGELSNTLGRPAEALADLERAIAASSDSVRAWELKARSLVLLRRIRPALEAIDRAIALVPDDAEKARFWFVKAGVLIEEGDLAATLAALDEVARHDPSCEKALFYLLVRRTTLLALERPEQVRELFERAARDAALSAEPQFQVAWGESLLLIGDFEGAARKFKPLADHDPEGTNASAWSACGKARGLLGQWVPAVAALERARALDAKIDLDLDFMSNLSLGLCETGRHADALEIANRFVGIAPTLPLAHTVRGMALAGMGRGEDAVVDLDRAIELCAKRAVFGLFERAAFIQKGWTLAAMNRHEEARAAFDAAARLAEAARFRPQHAIALVGKALTLYQRSSKEANEAAEATRAEALAAATRATQVCDGLKPDQIPALASWARGSILSWLERDEEALLEFEKARRFEPDRAHVRHSLGETHERLQDDEKAVAEFSEAARLASDPSDQAAAWRGRGRALLRLERYGEAIDACRQAIAADGESERILALLGRAYSALGRHDAALQTFRRGWAMGTPAKRSPSHALGVSAELLTLARDAEALAFLEKAERQTKFNGQLHFNRGVALYRLKQVGAAARSLQVAARMGVPGAAEHVEELTGGVKGHSWLAFWFGGSPWLRRALGIVLLAALGIALLPTLFKQNYLSALPWLDVTKDWKVMVIPIVLFAVLLALPSLKRVSFGDVEIDVSQPEPEAGRPDLAATLKAFIEAGASTSSLSSAVGTMKRP